MPRPGPRAPALSGAPLPPRSGSAASGPASLFLLHLLLITVGGNWSSISAHSCSRGCLATGGRGQLGQPPASLSLVRGPAAARRGGGTEKSAQPCQERMNQPLGAGQGTVLPFFSQAGRRYSRAEVCVHTGDALGTAPGRRPLAGRGAGTLTEPAPPCLPRAPGACCGGQWPSRPSPSEAPVPVWAMRRGELRKPHRDHTATTPRSHRETQCPPSINPALRHVTPESNLAVFCMPPQANSNALLLTTSDICSLSRGQGLGDYSILQRRSTLPCFYHCLLVSSSVMTAF